MDCIFMRMRVLHPAQRQEQTAPADLIDPHRRVFAQATRIAALILAAVFLEGWELGAQDRRRLVISDSVRLRTPPTISPRSGSPGTQVTVSAIHLPAITPVQIGIGATGAGFEVLDQMMTSPEGQITHTVRVPGWADRDRSHVFIVFDIYFRPLSLSGPFHVTDRNGLFTRAGRITRRDSVCTTMLADDGESYSLTGDTRELELEDEVIVEGTLAESSQCTQGIAVDVVRIR